MCENSFRDLLDRYYETSSIIIDLLSCVFFVGSDFIHNPVQFVFFFFFLLNMILNNLFNVNI